MARIFLASSKELEADRLRFEQDIARRNKTWQAEGIPLLVDLWESFDDSISPTRKQDDYNAAIAQADLFVLLVHTKVGKYTLEEFDAALAQFTKTGKPRIHTYFKNVPDPGEPDPGPEYGSVRALMQRLAQIGHWPNRYGEVSELLHHYGHQLDLLRSKGVLSAQAAPAAASAVSLSERAVYVNGPNHAPIHTGDTRIETGGGAYVEGGVKIGKGSFVGRDQRVTRRGSKT